MKKKILLLPFMSLCLSACAPSIDLSKKPEDWALKYWLLDSVDISKIDSKRLHKNYEHSYSYLDDNYPITERFTYYGYTDSGCVTYNLFSYNDLWVVTQIEVFDADINFYDITTSTASLEKFCKGADLEKEEHMFDCYSNEHYILKVSKQGFSIKYIY